VLKLKQTLFLNFILKKKLRKKSKKRENFEILFLMIWSIVHLVITSGHFGAFILPLRPHKTSDQYPLLFKNYVPFFKNQHFSKIVCLLFGLKLFLNLFRKLQAKWTISKTVLRFRNFPSEILKISSHGSFYSRFPKTYKKNHLP
jgi:hypothetical protein